MVCSGDDGLFDDSVVCFEPEAGVLESLLVTPFFSTSWLLITQPNRLQLFFVEITISRSSYEWQVCVLFCRVFAQSVGSVIKRRLWIDLFMNEFFLVISSGFLIVYK